jgi:dolichol kinase
MGDLGMSRLVPTNLVFELLWASALFAYILALLKLTKRLYDLMISRGLKVNVAVYYNRKIIHMAAGGLVAALTPSIFTSPLIPCAFALVLALMLYIPHKKHKLLGWFQTGENMYEVNFCVAWGLSLLVLWVVTDDPLVAIIPPLFISFGDAVTGVIRNSIYGRRTKSWIGNIGMVAITVPVGWYLAGYTGAIAGLISSLVERFEFPPYFDDNLLITLVSSLVLITAPALF